MDNIKEEKNNRSRGENWAQEEKDLFLEIMRQSAPIIENKMTDTNTNKRKNLEWVKIQNKFRELTGKPRDLTQLKGFWRRAKVGAKKTVSQHRRAVQATGGGQRPPSPPPDDLKILELCPTDFVNDENIYDSDAVSQQVQDRDIASVTVKNEAHNKKKKEEDIIYDIDEDVDSQLEGSFVAEIITVADVHSGEIDIKASGLNTKTGLINNDDKKTSKKNLTSKATVFQSNIEIKKRALEMMEEEHKLKLKYQTQEIVHQQLRQKMEIELLMIEKEKKKIELQLLKNKINDNL